MNPDAVVADLDPDQRAAVTSTSHLIAVIAGAGSGKTRVLTRRIAYRVATGDADARHTLALTFTREAAGELRRRLARLGIREQVEAGTFHSVALGILRQRWEDRGVRPRTVVSDQHRLLSEATGSDDRRHLDHIAAEVAWAGARGIAPPEYLAAARAAGRRPPGGLQVYAAALARHAELKRARGIIDFDDVLSLVCRGIDHDPEFAATLRWRFRHLMVDEAQDLNPVQRRLVDQLRAGRDDLFVVGDPSQAIYGFNGADPSLLVDVEERFPGVEVIRLPVNHRCTPQIVRAGVHVLTAGRQRVELVSSRADGRPVALLAGADDVDEASRVADLLGAGDPNIVRSGQAAVLARTHAQLTSLRRALTARGVPVRRSASDRHSPLQASVREAALNPSSSRLRAWAHDTLELLDGRHVGTGIGDAVGADDRPAVDYGPRGRVRRTRELATGDDPRLGSERDDADRRVAAAALEFLREHPLGDGARFRAWVATTNPFDDAEDVGVELATFHASKGREWHTVVVTGVETGLVPHRSATTNAGRAEEARLLYVALTRATDRLVVSRAMRRGGYARTLSPLVEGLVVAEPPAPPPPRPRRNRRGDSLPSALRAWRDETARRARVLPHQICSDRDLAQLARHRPSTVEQISAVTSIGPITAERLGPDLLRVIGDAHGAPEPSDDASAQASQSDRSTTTGA